ncbi:NAD(P)/FAD-dependent oxidoreductase [Akkermansiaceae bacterium]|nr:NAD(P)/FAD-dependent oxidoreductase [Akkermansiaceae bacterium]
MRIFWRPAWAAEIAPNLYFAGEVLDVDGVTGGFNFQSAWTTGHLAGLAVNERLHCNSSGIV